MTCFEIELAIVRRFGIRKHIIVSNIHWGLNLHECDLLVVTKAGYASEIEIKTTKADLKRDALKKHNHHSDKIKHLWFAIPEKLKDSIPLIPEHAGVFLLQEGSSSLWAEVYRKPSSNVSARKFTDKEMMKLAHLGTMRIWGLKNTIVTLKKQIKDYKNPKHGKKMPELQETL